MVAVALLKDNEVVVLKDDFGYFAQTYVKDALRVSDMYSPEHTLIHLRKVWPKIEDYYQRKIIAAIEIAIILDDPPRRGRNAMVEKHLWQGFIKEFRPAPSAFTMDYHCHKCKAKGSKALERCSWLR